MQESSSFATDSQRAPRSESAARADRAVHLAHFGELSAGHAALPATPLAPGDATTLGALRDPSRRLSEPYAPLDPNILQWLPDKHCSGPRHLQLGRPLALRLHRRYDVSFCSMTLWALKPSMVPPKLPASAASALGLGRIVALSKPTDRVCGIVVGRHPVGKRHTQPHNHVLLRTTGCKLPV